MIRLGVIGYGYWGPNLVRNFAALPDAEIRAIVDVREQRLQAARQRWRDVHLSTDSCDVIFDPEVDAVAIATPVATHHELALAALRAGKHVLVEKPMTSTSSDATELIAEAEAGGLTLMVDHTFVYSSAVREIRRLIGEGAIGAPLFYDGMRTSLDRYQPEVGVLRDLAVHDLAIIDAVMPGKPTGISATGIAVYPGGPPDLASMTLHFDDRCIAHVHANWLSAVKIRRAFIGGDGGMIVYDAIDPSESVKVYEGVPAEGHGGAIRDELRTGYRAGRMWSPRLENVEPLHRMARHFIDCVHTGSRPETDGKSAFRVLSWLDAASESMARSGELIRLERPVECR